MDFFWFDARTQKPNPPNTSPAPCALPPSVPAKSCAESALATWRHATRCGQELGKRHRVEHTWNIYIYICITIMYIYEV